MNDLTALLPPPWLAWIEHWTPYVLLALLLTTALAHALLPLGRWLRDRALATTATWDDRVALALVDGCLWVIAVSSTILAWLPRLAIGRTATTTATVEARLRDRRRPPTLRGGPPSPPSSGALAIALIILAAVCSTITSGCGVGALDAHTRTLAVLVDTHGIAGGVADAAYQRELDAAETVEEVDAVEAEWSPVASGLDAVREGILGYASSLAAGILDAAGEAWVLPAGAALARVVLAYDDAADAMRAKGLAAPSLPDVVTGLAELVGGAR